VTEQQPTPPTVDPEQVRAAVEQVRAALRAWAEAVAPSVRALVAEFARLAEHLREAGVVDDQGRPARRDRPAWQSPYGPPPRRRKH
jgi:acyl-CoA reductase-like NAD-dependent aldehyde dehydrogenase